MFADVMDMPVETVSAEETGALGCCVAVAAALGDYQDAADAAAHMCRSVSRVLPRPDGREGLRGKIRAVSQNHRVPERPLAGYAAVLGGTSCLKI